MFVALVGVGAGGALRGWRVTRMGDLSIKYFFRDKEQQGIIHILTKKPIEASQQEVSVNPRARSAKLRVIIKI